MFECFEFENGGKRNGGGRLCTLHQVQTWRGPGRGGPVAGAPDDISSQLY